MTKVRTKIVISAKARVDLWNECIYWESHAVHYRDTLWLERTRVLKEWLGDPPTDGYAVLRLPVGETKRCRLIVSTLTHMQLSGSLRRTCQFIVRALEAVEAVHPLVALGACADDNDGEDVERLRTEMRIVERSYRPKLGPR